MIYGASDGDICPICGKTMNVEDTSFTHEFGIEAGDLVYCNSCDVEEDYNICNISYNCDSINISNITYRVFSTDKGVIVTAGDDVICELTELDTDGITELISVVLGCEECL